MLSSFEKIIFVLGFMLSVYLGWRSFSTMFRVINKGQDKLHFDNIRTRISKSLSAFILQSTVLTSRPLISIIHAVVAWAFILYMLVNIGDILTGFIPNFHFLGNGTIGHFYRLFVDVFSVLALIGVIILLFRRFVFSSPDLQINENILLLPSARSGIRRDSLLVGLFIFGLVGFRFLGVSFNLAARAFDTWQALASSLAYAWKDFDPELLLLLVQVMKLVSIILIMMK